MKKIGIAKRYSDVFKRQVVRDIEHGRTTSSEVARRYGITGATTIAKWLQHFGTSRTISKNAKQPRQDQSRKVFVLERRTRELEQVVARLTVEKVALESVLEEAQSHFGVDLKKTFGMGR
jgi:transposase-like protein